MKALNVLIVLGMTVVGTAVIGMSVRPTVAPVATPVIALVDDYAADDYVGYLSVYDLDEIEEFAYRRELALREEIDRRERIDAEDSLPLVSDNAIQPNHEDLTGSFTDRGDDDEFVYFWDIDGFGYRWFDDE